MKSPSSLQRDIRDASIGFIIIVLLPVFMFVVLIPLFCAALIKALYDILKE